MLPSTEQLSGIVVGRSSYIGGSSLVQTTSWPSRGGRSKPSGGIDPQRGRNLDLEDGIIDRVRSGLDVPNASRDAWFYQFVEWGRGSESHGAVNLFHRWPTSPPSLAILNAAPETQVEIKSYDVFGRSGAPICAVLLDSISSDFLHFVPAFSTFVDLAGSVGWLLTSTDDFDADGTTLENVWSAGRSD